MRVQNGAYFNHNCTSLEESLRYYHQGRQAIEVVAGLTRSKRCWRLICFEVDRGGRQSHLTLVTSRVRKSHIYASESFLKQVTFTSRCRCQNSWLVCNKICSQITTEMTQACRLFEIYRNHIVYSIVYLRCRRAWRPTAEDHGNQGQTLGRVISIM